jgi:predicted ATPase/class 3 adenylate cyclase
VATTTLVFTDIEGSTRLLQQLGDAYGDALRDHHALVREAFTRHGGVEVDAMGDGFYFHFPSAREAVAATVDAQRALLAHAWPQGVQLRVRMGLHTGEPQQSAVGMIGLDVHRAARIGDAGHGGQVLVSRTARDLIGAELPAGVRLTDLGIHALKDLGEPQQLFQVVADGLPADFPPLRTLDARPNNLPRRLSSFVGREQDLQQAREIMRSAPLLTLTGPGGVGKTRFALQIALELLDDFEDGVWLVELGSLSDPELVLQTIAAALNVTEQPGRTLAATLDEHLRARHLCLLLDNCEHLLEACASHAFALLSACPSVRILATSREALGIEGEHVFPVPSLGLPRLDHAVGAVEAGKWEAIRLFVDRASAANPGFALTDQNATVVAQICHRLDGIPLAIELAAARVRALPVEQIAARLDDRFRLLAGGNRVAVTRHQTLRATIDWSHELLSSEERAVFRRLAVFAGGSTLAAAEAVAADGDVAPEDVLDILSRLVDKSLVIADSVAGESRFRLLETIRQYARERLVDAGEAEDTYRRHRDWYLALVERAKPDFFRGPAPVAWLDEFEREHDNLRLALEWSSAESEGRGSGLRLAAGLWRYWEMRGYLVEGRQWLERTLAATDGEVSVLRANALTGAGILAHIQGDAETAIRYHEQSLGQQRQLGNQNAIAYALHNLANIAAEQRDYERARTLYEEALDSARQMGDQRGAALGMISLADVMSRQGDYAAAAALFDQAVAFFDEMKDRWGTAFALDNHGLAVARSGDGTGAQSLHERALAISHELGDERGVARSLMHLADAAAQEGDLTRARSLQRECLRIRFALRDMPGVATAMERMAWVVMADAAEDAARLIGAAQALRETIKAPLPVAAREDYERYVRMLATRMGEQAFEQERLAGRMMAPDRAVAAVLEGEADAAAADPTAAADPAARTPG